MLKSFIEADTEFIESKHTGKYVSNLTFDVTKITNLLTNALLNLFKDSLTLIGLLCVMFYQNWKLSLIAIIIKGITSINACSFSIKIFFIAGSSSQAILEVLPATRIEKKPAIKI